MPALTFVATLEAVTQAGGDACRRRRVGGRPQPRPRRRRRCGDHRAHEVRAAGPPLRPARRHAPPRRAAASSVIEDACQAHGAERDGLRAGACGRAAAFSFYPGKNLGAMGDAGALTTDDEELADTVRRLARARAAPQVRARLRGLHRRASTRSRRSCCSTSCRSSTAGTTSGGASPRYYLEALDGHRRPAPSAGRGGERAGLAPLRDPDGRSGRARGVPARAGSPVRDATIPIPVHLTAAYAHLGHAEGAFPVAESVARGCLSLPIFPGMTDSDSSSASSLRSGSTSTWLTALSTRRRIG